MFRINLLSIFVVHFILSSARCVANEPSVEQVRAGIEKSLPYIAERGAWWIEEKDCNSCHRVGNMLWSLTEAQRLGFEVDEQLEEWSSWAVDSAQVKDKEGVLTAAKNKEGVAQLLLVHSTQPFLSDKTIELFLQVFKDAQAEDGRWNADGQLPAQKRKPEETADVSTAWIALAIANSQSNHGDSDALTAALDALEKRQQAESTEWFAVRLLLANELSQSSLVVRFHSKLVELQHADGGWGWLHEEPSDALGTGLALYALARTEKAASETQSKAIEFLLSTQKPNGTWDVKGTKKNKRKRVEETATYWGTAWATQALVATLPTTSAATD